jgi:hypothetical protein
MEGACCELEGFWIYAHLSHVYSIAFGKLYGRQKVDSQQFGGVLEQSEKLPKISS